MGITLVDLPVRRVDLPGGPLAVTDVGAGRPAVFVPGYTGGKEDLSLLAAPVAAAGFRFVAMDLRGQFESPGPADPAAYTVEALATDVLGLLASLGPEPVHLVGHSFGGLVARAAAIRSPEAVASLVLLGSGPAALSGPRVDFYRTVEPVLDSGGMPAVFDVLMDRAGIADAELAAFLRRRFLASSETGLRAMGDALLAEPDRTAALRETGVPVLVACGEHDDAWPPYVQKEMAERLGAPYAEIPGAAHSPAAERPAETFALLRGFWEPAS